jgi:Flp pilus assembly protein CpaB
MATRRGSLTLAVLCAVCAAGILIFTLGRYKTSLKTTVPQATVLVATAEIAKGTAGSAIAQEKLYRPVSVAATQLTPGAISDAGVLANETAQSDILPGQQLTAADFAGLTAVSETLAPNQRAVSVSIGESPGNTDIVQPGDHVDIYESLLVPHTSGGGAATATATATANSAIANQSIVLPVITDALVLKPATPVPAKRDGVPITGGSMVVAVPAGQVQLLISAAMKNSLYLSLRPTDASATPGTQLANHFTQLSTAALSTLSKSFPTTITGAN